MPNEARWKSDSGTYFTSRVCPAVRRFVKAYSLKVQAVTVSVAINPIENREGLLGEVFSGRDTFQYHRFVLGQCLQKLYNRRVAGIDEEGVIPQVDQMLLGQRLDLGEIHDHSVGCVTVLADDVAGKRNFQRVAMAVQMAALTFVVWNAVAGIKLKAASDKHRKT